MNRVVLMLLMVCGRGRSSMSLFECLEVWELEDYSESRMEDGVA